jgi:hypothetical protein
MRTLGIVYLVGYLIDLCVSIVASSAPGLEGLSNAISSLLSVASIAVLILACLNKLRPRLFFLLAAGYYLFMVGIGFVLGVALAFKLGAQEAAQQISEQSMTGVLRQQFAWYVFLHWTLLTVWALLGLYGLRAVFTGADKTELAAAPNGGPASPPPIPTVTGGPPSVS